MKKLLLSLGFIFPAIFLFAQDVYFTADIDEGCANLTVNFTNETHLLIDTTNMFFIWSFGDGTGPEIGYHMQHIFVSPGNYTVYVYADSLGKYIGEFSMEINVAGISGVFYPMDSAVFCNNERINFYIPEPYNSISWDFDDGTDPAYWNYAEHIYAEPGFYDVKLIVDHNCGLDTITQTIEISTNATPSPHINVSQSYVCPNDEITFSSDINGIDFLWDFGDGSTSDLSEANHSFSSVGTYKVKLDVTNICGNTGTDSVEIVVTTGLEAYADFNWWGDGCPNSPINLNAWSSGIYKWDFGNGQTGTNKEETVVYSSPGTYTVRLIVENGCGDIDTTQQDIIIGYNPENKPWAEIGMYDNNYNDIDTLLTCPGSEVVFRNNSGGSSSSGVGYTWYYGVNDSLVTSDEEVVFTFDALGKSEVLLVARNTCGGVDTARKWIFVTDTLTPIADLQILPPIICPGEYVYFYDEERNDNHLYSIWFGDGFYVENVGPENDSIVPVTARHQYFNLGAYEYTFSVSNTCGNSHTIVDTIYVTDTLSSGFFMAFSETDSDPNGRACPEDIIEFYGIGGTSVIWDFGNEVYDSNIIGRHSYPAPGDYTALAIFTTGCGTTDTVEVMAYVGTNNSPESYFDYSYNGFTLCPGEVVDFVYYGWSEDKNLTFLWTFGDGNTSTESNPTHIYDTSGNFKVELSVTNGCGTSTNYQYITVGGIFIDDSGLTLTDPDCGTANGSISGIATVGNSLSSATWYNANEEEIGSSLDISSLSAGEYKIKVESALGCEAWSEPYVLNNQNAPDAPLATTPAPYCEGDVISALVATAQSGGTLNWYSDPILTNSVGTGTSYTPSTNTTASYYVTETTGNCESPATVVAVVFNMTYNVKDTLTLCEGDSYFVDGAFQTEPGTYVDILVSGVGCDSVVSTTLYFKPVSRHEESVEICQGDKYWVEGEWQSEPGLYFDTLLAANGCDSIIETTLSLRPIYNMHYGANICTGDSIYLEGVWQKTSGVYTDLYVSQHGCDSLVEITLNVGSLYISSEYLTICSGDSVEFDGEWRKVSGTYNDTIVSGTSCDSINQLVLTVGDLFETPMSKTICQGDSAKLEGAWQTVSGVYHDTLQSFHGCDSVIVTTLTVLPKYNIKVTETICDGDSLMINGEWRKEAGVFTEYLNSQHLCDSIVETTLTLLSYTDYGTKNKSICQGDSILLGSVWRHTAGTYADTVSSPSCDSVFSVVLTVNACTNYTINQNYEPLSIYPNPSDGIVTIKLDNVTNDELTIYNSSGMLVYKTRINNNEHKIDLNEMPQGIYVVHYRNTMHKLILQE